MKHKLLIALLGSAALVAISTLSTQASTVTPISGIPVGLEGDPGSIVVATTKTDADGKFEFLGLMAGKYRLVVGQSDTTPAKSETQVLDGAQLQLARTFTITVTPVNDAPSIAGSTRGTDRAGHGDVTLKFVAGASGGVWKQRSQDVLTISADGGTIRGTFKIAENESPRPQNRSTIDANAQTTPGAAPVDPNAWRYKHQNGEWWYYGTDEKWLVHRNGTWTKYVPTAGTTGSARIFDRWGNRTPAPGQNLLPVVGDWDGDGRADVQTVKPGNTGPRVPAANVPIPGIPLRRAPGKR